MRKERASFLRGQARRAHTNHQHTRDKDWKKSCNTSTHHTLHTVNSKQTFRISVSYEQQTAHTDVWLAFPLRKKKTHWQKKKNSVIQAWHVGDNSDLMSVLAASVECRQWLTKHFWVQGTVVLKENSDDLHLIAAKPRASARPAPHARSDRLSYLPRVWRPYARAPPLTPEEVRFLTKRRCKYDIQTSVPIQPEPSKPVRDRRDAGRECKCATSLCGTLCACRMDDFLTFWNNFHKIIFAFFTIL